MARVTDGTAELSELRLVSVARESSVLDPVRVDGVQPAVASCPEAGDAVDGGWLCAGTTTRHYAGPIVTDVTLSGGAALAPGGTEHLLLTARLPATTTADLVEGATSSLDFVFSGTQRDGVAR